MTAEGSQRSSFFEQAKPTRWTLHWLAVDGVGVE